ncbi:hypothetical protein N0V83_002251 [Neocucurbitaria cava]|uniref:Uncharacterized protein n=1 Tax=Neocucurbitaria cava TaxID=798079 RepID=A0A9W8YH46_9PLEO|nr:hypothetical protein N0V83_002251 [Neocucurbitaria cava]
METTQQQLSPQLPLSKASPIIQHALAPGPPPDSPDATQTIFLNHPSARISSSPASSPRIVDPPPKRHGSVHPAMSGTMEGGGGPGANFFDDGSSESEWEDSDGDVTQTFSESEGLGLKALMQGAYDGAHGSRGRSRDRGPGTALPASMQLPAHDSGLGTENEHFSSPVENKGTKRAREMSLKRLGKDNVRLVHTRSTSGTPRGSVGSNISEINSPLAELPKPLPNSRRSEAFESLPKSNSFKGRHRRNTSESVIADSIIDAHVRTMRALEALSPSASLSQAQGRSYPHSTTTSSFPKLSSFTADRHIKITPLSTVDRERPAHLPSHFIRTPYPFTAKKEFPKPKSRPRQRGIDGEDGRGSGDFERLDSGYSEQELRKEYDGRKGKHMLGLICSEGEYDLRSRIKRNEDAQGVIRSLAGSGREGKERVVWLSLQKRTWRRRNGEDARNNLVRIDVPSDLTAASPIRYGKKTKSNGGIEFDDKFFAEQLRAGHHELAGNRFARTFSARKLRRIQLGPTNTWSGCPSQDSTKGTAGLLASGEGIDVFSDSKSPFTEDGLMSLYKKPITGKARYTWVHWARRVAAPNDSQRPLAFQHYATTRPSRRRARSLDSPRKEDEKVTLCAYLHDESATVADTITTIQFVHTLSTLRILFALMLMLALSVGAALLWIFLGAAGTGWRLDLSRQRSDRVGSGMAIGILTLLLEGLGFVAWVLLS